MNIGPFYGTRSRARRKRAAVLELELLVDSRFGNP